MNHSKQITILSVAVAILFTSVIFLLYLNFHKTPVLVSVPTTGIIPTEVTTPTAVPTVDPTVGWKTYTNPRFNFTFKYPDDYFKYTGDMQSEVDLLPSQGTGEAAGTPMGLTLGDVWFTITYKSADPNQKDQAKQIVTLGGPQPVSSFQVQRVYQNNVYTIELSAFNQKTLTENESLFDQILSTFKFTENKGSLELLISKINQSLSSNLAFTNDQDKYSVNLSDYYNEEFAKYGNKLEQIKKAIYDAGFVNDKNLNKMEITTWSSTYKSPLHSCLLSGNEEFLNLICQ